MKKRPNKISTRDRILAAAVTVANTEGLDAVTRTRVAQLADVWENSVSWAFNSMANLKTHVIRHAIEKRLLRIIAEALAAKHPVAMAASTELKTAALATLQ